MMEMLLLESLRRKQLHRRGQCLTHRFHLSPKGETDILKRSKAKQLLGNESEYLDLDSPLDYPSSGCYSNELIYLLLKSA